MTSTPTTTSLPLRPLLPPDTLPTPRPAGDGVPGFLDEVRESDRLGPDDDARHTPRRDPEQHRASRAHAVARRS